jgi:CRISPR-associated protein Cas5d
MRPSVQTLEVWGDLACFTRPEMKVERFSYPVITPSAARAVFEAIYWKPQFRWQVTQIELLEPPRYIALRRNEVKGKVPAPRTIEQWRTGKQEPQPLWADGDDEATGRTQRQTMALKDVRCRLHAEIRPWPDHVAELPALEAQFRRRAARGQCIYQPYLGCREFPAFFRLLNGEPTQPPTPLDLDLGLMLYDVFDLSRPGGSADPPSISLFQATVRGGILTVPDYADPAVLKAVKEER